MSSKNGKQILRMIEKYIDINFKRYIHLHIYNYLDVTIANMLLLASYLKFVKILMVLVLIYVKFHGYNTMSPVHQCN